MCDPSSWLRSLIHSHSQSPRESAHMHKAVQRKPDFLPDYSLAFTDFMPVSLMSLSCNSLLHPLHPPISSQRKQTPIIITSCHCFGLGIGPWVGWYLGRHVLRPAVKASVSDSLATRKSALAEALGCKWILRVIPQGFLLLFDGVEEGSTLHENTVGV